MKIIKLIEKEGNIFIASYGDKYEVSDEEYLKITSGKFLTKLIDGNFVFDINQEYIDTEKLEMINEYKIIQSNIVEAKAELQEIIDTYESYNEQGKQIADLQKVNIENKLTELRARKDILVLSGVEKFGTEIIKEL